MAMTLAASVLAGCSDDTVSPTDQQPVLAAISPDSGGVGTAIDVLGKDFQPGAVVYFGATATVKVTFISGTHVRAYAPDGLVRGDVYPVKIRNATSLSSDASSPFKAVAPELTVVNGASKPSGTHGSTVIFEGRSFGDLLGKGAVYFTGAGSQPVEAPVSLEDNWTNEYVIAAVPADAETGPVWVETPTGTTATIQFSIPEAASFSPSEINWTETTSLPVASQGHGAHFLAIEDGPGKGNLVYVTGGADGTPTARADVVVGEIDAGGHIVSWTPATPLFDERAFHATATATPRNALVDTSDAGYLYAVGGINSSGETQATVFVSAIGKDRSLAGWLPTSPLPVPLHSPGAAILRSWLYVVGGSTTGDVPVSTVYRARIESDGNLGAWEELASLPEGRSYAPLVQFAGHLYIFGGDTGISVPGSNTIPSSATKQILYQPIDLRTGGLKNGSWSVASSSLIKAATKHSVIVAGGWLLASGGLYGGAANSATEHQYASIDVDGAVKSFNGATGSQTIVGGAGGVPFYNHAAVTYVDDSGVAHVVIIGGGNVLDATTPVANCYFY